MGLEDILVHIDDSIGAAARRRVAIALAKRHQAHLTGLYIEPTCEVPLYTEFDLRRGTIQLQQEAFHKAALEAEREFAASAEAAGVRSEWRGPVGNPFYHLLEASANADIVVIGTHASHHLGASEVELVETVLLSSGRPILVVPDESGAGADAPGDWVTIAWDGGRESARAVNDALPILKGAKQVAVLTIDDAADSKNAGSSPSADLCLHLARHSILAEAHDLQSHELGVGERILEWSARESMDLIVMGGYGHSRLRELVLGGVTRHVLANLHTPVLMSH